MINPLTGMPFDFSFVGTSDVRGPQPGEQKTLVAVVKTEGELDDELRKIREEDILSCLASQLLDVVLSATTPITIQPMTTTSDGDGGRSEIRITVSAAPIEQ